MSDFSKERVFGLDFVRSLAICCVLASHSRVFAVYPDEFLWITFGGWYGVELFFVLSGYLIGTILIRQIINGFDLYQLLIFWKRRWFRTIPLYMVVLTLAMVSKGKTDFAYVFFAQGIVNGNWDILPVSWSLCIEEWFYICLPIFFLVMGLFHYRPRASCFLAVVFFLVFPVFLRVLQYKAHVDGLDVSLDYIRKFTFRFDCIACGLFLAYIQTCTNYMTSWVQSIWPKFLGVVFLISCCFYYEAPLLGMGSVRNNFVFVVLYPLWTAISCGLVLLSCLSLPPAPLMVKRAIQFVSVTSYSLYLWHLALIGLVKGTVFSTGPSAIAIFWVTTLIVGGLSYMFIERPFLRLRDVCWKNLWGIRGAVS
jgi:peptidoglycan/LPS O-acetylase OafA/YrhL